MGQYLKPSSGSVLEDGRIVGKEINKNIYVELASYSCFVYSNFIY